MLNTSKIDKFIKGGCNKMPEILTVNGKSYVEVKTKGMGIVGGKKGCVAKVGEYTRKGVIRQPNKNKGKKELNSGLKEFNEKVKILRENNPGLSQKEAQQELKGTGIVGGKKTKKKNLAAYL